MRKTLLRLGLLVAIVIFTGCSITPTHTTVVKLDESSPNIITIHADRDSSMMSLDIMKHSIINKNYRYIFATAATKTKEAGYKYFSFLAPLGLLEVYKDRGVVDTLSALESCNDGKAKSFRTTYSLWGKKPKLGCNQMKTRGFAELVMTMGQVVHYPLEASIEMHNEDRQDNNTFSPDEVLSNKYILELDSEYFMIKGS